MSGFMGVGMGMNANGNYFAQASQTNQQQMQENKTSKTHKGLQTLGLAQCGTENTGKFCSNCGTPKPTNEKPKLEMKCSECSEIVDLSNGIPKFCPHCGKPFQGVPL